MFWSSKIQGKFQCPECQSALEFEPHAYALAVREGSNIQSFVVGPKGGYFCVECPTVVLDRDTFVRMASLASGCDCGAKFAVLGLVDLDAIPEDKRSLPLGHDDNPIPLVEFTNLSHGSEIETKKSRSARSRKRGKRGKKRRRRS